jgi:type VI secretion system ImpA family protein
MKESKDLQIAAWLTEAWLNIEGLKGLSRGFHLVQELCQNYWKTIHPQIENNDFEFRLAPLEWMNDRLSEQCRFTNISSPTDQAIPAFTWADVHDANTLEAQARRHKDGAKLLQQAEEEGKGSFAKISLSISQTPTQFFKKVIADSKQVLSAIEKLEASLLTLCPTQIPSFYKIRNVLSEIQRYARGHFDDRQPMMPTLDDLADEHPPELNVLTNESLQLSPITSRAEAYAKLTQAADYLLRTEPHSPTPYLIKRAVIWGSMPLHELYQEIITDEKDLDAIKRLLGFQGIGKNRSVA